MTPQLEQAMRVLAWPDINKYYDSLPKDQSITTTDQFYYLGFRACHDLMLADLVRALEIYDDVCENDDGACRVEWRYKIEQELKEKYVGMGGVSKLEGE
jgi:hypothetical protein